MKYTFIIIVTSFLIACSAKQNSSVSNKGNESKLLEFTNEEFYSNGKFDTEKAKDAILRLMKFHNYPIYPNIKEKIWVSDFGAGQFTKAGLAVIMWTNNKEDKYMLMDIFLLPNQMLPEHLHRGHSNKKIPPKAEGWLIRHGTSYVAEIGTNNLSDFALSIPKIHNDGNVAAEHVVKANSGTYLDLSNPKSSPYHWQMAGDKGAIINEVAVNHSSSHVTYRDRKMHEFIYGK